MATVHREPNQVKWVGVRPGHNGEQINRCNTVDNGTVILYTVPADKLLLIHYHYASGFAAANGILSFSIFDAVPANVGEIWQARFRTAEGWGVAVSHFFPIEIPTGYSLRLISDTVGVTINAGFHGILIDM